MEGGSRCVQPTALLVSTNPQRGSSETPRCVPSLPHPIHNFRRRCCDFMVVGWMPMMKVDFSISLATVRGWEAESRDANQFSKCKRFSDPIFRLKFCLPNSGRVGRPGSPTQSRPNRRSWPRAPGTAHRGARPPPMTTVLGLG